MPKYSAALDQGTTSTRAMVFDHSGRVVSVSQKEHEQIFPKPGWVEHDPMEIWAPHAGGPRRGALARPARAPTTSRASASRTSARPPSCGTATPASRSTTRSSGRTPAPTSSSTSSSADGGQDRFKEQTGLPLATYFSGPKVRWILDNVDGAREKAESGDLLFGNIDTWVIWNLTGGTDGGLHMTDVTNASRTLHVRPQQAGLGREHRVDDRRPDVDAPEVRASSEVYGEVKSGGFAGVQIAGDLGDQQAATFGQTCFAVGEAKNTYGTGNFLLLNTGTEAVQSKNGLLTTVCYKIGDADAVYALEGSIAVTGSLVQWLRDNLKLIKAAPEVEELRRVRRRQRRPLHRPGVLRPVRAVLEVQRARRVRRA